MPAQIKILRFSLFFSFFIIFWDVFAQEAKLVLPAGHLVGLKQAIFSPDGKYVLTVTEYSSAKLWQTKSGKLIYTLNYVDKPYSIINRPYSIKFTSDGTYIIIVIGEHVQVWETLGGKLLRTFYSDEHYINEGLSPDGKTIATVENEKIIKIREISSGKLLHTLLHEEYDNTILRFSPNGRYLITLPYYQYNIVIKIWDTQTGIVLDSIIVSNKNNLVSNFIFSPDGKFIYVDFRSEGFYQWEVGKGELKDSFESGNNSDISPDGKQVVVSGKNSSIREISSGKVLDILEKSCDNVKYSPDGKYILGSDNIYNTIYLYDVKSGRLLFEIKGDEGVRKSAVFSPDGKYIGLAWGYKTVQLWETVSGKLIHNIESEKGYLHGFNFSPDSKYLITFYDNGTAKLWETGSGKLVNSLENHIRESQGLVFSDNQKYFAFESINETLKVCETLTGKLLYTLKEDGSIEFSPNGELLEVSTYRHKIQIFETSTGKYLYTLKETKGRYIISHFSPDGKYIATISEDGFLDLKESGTGKLIWQIFTNDYTHIQLLYSPDGKYLLIWKDSIAKIIEAASGNLIYTLNNESYIYDCFFNPNGKYIVTYGQYENPKIWETLSGKLLYILQDNGSRYSNELFFGQKYIGVYRPNDSLCIYDFSSGKLKYSKANKNDEYKSFRFSPDEKYLIRESEYECKIIEVSTGKITTYIKSNPNKICKEKYSGDKKYIITYSDDNESIKIWEASSGNLLYTFAAIDSNDYVVVDRYGRYDGTVGGIAMLHYTCGNEIIELNDVKNQGWEPGLVSKLTGQSKEPITAKKLSKINPCKFKYKQNSD